MLCSVSLLLLVFMLLVFVLLVMGVDFFVILVSEKLNFSVVSFFLGFFWIVVFIIWLSLDSFGGGL